MKVILNQDIKKLGKKGDVVEVAKGYARNYLLPKNLGIKATPKNILLAEKMQEKRQASIEAVSYTHLTLPTSHLV